jgi:hypothetical protein
MFNKKDWIKAHPEYNVKRNNEYAFRKGIWIINNKTLRWKEKTQNIYSMNLFIGLNLWQKRICYKCKKIKDVSCFHRNGLSYVTTCKDCDKLRHTPEFYFKRRLRNYDMDENKYNELHKKQDGKCATCGDMVELKIDHNHSTGDVRGLLCEKCNAALGMARDNVNILKHMIEYLERSQTND